jgi:hypothetical protein
MLKSSSLCLYSSNLRTCWLKIEQFWPFEEINIFNNLLSQITGKKLKTYCKKIFHHLKLKNIKDPSRIYLNTTMFMVINFIK